MLNTVRFVNLSCAATVLGVTATVLGLTMSGQALAQDWYTGHNRNLQPPAISTNSYQTPGEENWIVAVDASLSGTSRLSSFGDLSATFAALGNLTETGTRFRIEGLSGNYAYIPNTIPREVIRAKQTAGTASFGYQWMGHDTTLALYMGAIIQTVSLSVADTNNGVVGNRVGMKVSAEAYTHPNAQTMAFGYASYSSLNSSYYTRLKYGWAIGENTYVGPEISALGDAQSRQLRLGVHMTGLRVASMQLGLSGGFMNDRALGNGVYGILDARVGF